MMTIAAAKPGDVLVLTKPIGIGAVATAIKAEKAPRKAVEAAVASMTHLNDRASRSMLDAGVRGCTDVTGFGLLGHLGRMLTASGAAARIDATAVPVLRDAALLVARGHVPGGTQRNRDALAASTDWGDADEITQILLSDAQTSGGLLGACPPGAARDLVGELSGEPAAAIVGEVVEGEAGHITVTGRVE
jgi:selenide,water dikinase